MMVENPQLLEEDQENICKGIQKIDTHQGILEH
jgi:hypothetical protein